MRGSSLATLLSDSRGILEYLNLSRNSIDSEAVIILAISLAKNTKLDKVFLNGNIDIGSIGWKAILKLVCNSVKAVVESNHKLAHADLLDNGFKPIRPSLGRHDANLLLGLTKCTNL